MRNLLLVARREYLEQIRGRAFRITTVLVPALFLVLIGIMILVGRSASGPKNLVVASNDAVLAGEVRQQLVAGDQSKSSVEVQAPVTPQDRTALVDRVRTGSIDGFLWIDAPAGQTPKATYESQSSGDFITDAKLSAALNHAESKSARDALVVATAQLHSLVLVTRNVAAFKTTRVKLFNPWGYTPEEETGDDADWQQVARSGPLWLKNLFLRV